MTFDDYINQAKSFLLNLAVKQVYNLIISKAAWLAWGPVGYLLERLIRIILKKAIYETEMAIFFLYTDVRVNAQGRKFYEAIEKNLTAQKEGDENEKKKAEENLINSFRDLVKLTN